jgi:hypothetical protein
VIIAPVSSAKTPMAQPSRVKPAASSSGEACPFAWITPSTVICVIVVSLMPGSLDGSHPTGPDRPPRPACR